MNLLSKQPLINLLGVLLLMLLISGCEAWRVPESDLPRLPTRTPGSPATATQPISTPDENVMTEQPTLTPTATIINPPTALFGGDAASGGGGVFPTRKSLEIVYFLAEPQQSVDEEPVVLYWSARGAIEATVWQVNSDGTPGNTWAVSPEGSLTVVPAGDQRQQIYVLAISDGIATVEQRVSVLTACPTSWFFTPGPEEYCPSTPPLTGDALIQSFQRGWMIALAETNTIVVLYDDGQTPTWSHVVNPFSGGSPQTTPPLNPPSDLSVPERGFGRVWYELPDARDRLGWATSEAQDFTATLQRAVSAQGEHLFVTNNRGEVLWLEAGRGDWQVISRSEVEE